jgi:hypothetical protein
MGEGLEVGVHGTGGKEDSIAVVDVVDGVVQSDLACCVVLIVATFPIEPLVFEGVSVCIMYIGTLDEVVEGMGKSRFAN